VIAAIVILAAAAGYLGWTKIHPAAGHTSSPQPAVSTPARTPAPVPTTAAPIPPSSGAVQQSAGNSVPAETPEADIAPSARTSAVPKGAAAASVLAPITKVPKTSQTETPIVVKNGVANSARSKSAEPEVIQPPVLGGASSTDANAIAGLVNIPVSVPTQVPQTLRISQGVLQGMLGKKIPPTYPSQALKMHKEGAVQLVAGISKIGDITSVKLLSGDPILGRAAMEAVKQWKYKPYLLNGEPVAIQTQVTVNFKLP
jgi:protein TonB